MNFVNASTVSNTDELKVQWSPAISNSERTGQKFRDSEYSR